MGIGGIGMSGIATILRYQGYEISGCDLDLNQKSVSNLIKIGCKISEGHNSQSCKSDDIDVIVYSSAVDKNNPEIISAQEKGIPIIRRALMLAELMRTKYSIAITGSHGKTTTTSMISHILLEAKMDPTVIIGGHLKNISNNAKLGLGDFLVAEADESDKSILNLHPTIGIITNIDLEHLETYKDFDDIKNTYYQFLANNIPFYGKAILWAEDPGIKSLPEIPHIKTIKYGFSQNFEINAQNIILEPDSSNFELFRYNEKLADIVVNIPGKHNVLNALAAICLSLELDIDLEIIKSALFSFKGVERRFTFHGTSKTGAEIFDDYAHHPNEILNILECAQKRKKNKLRVIFQPHRYTRTEKLWNDFIKVFIDNPVDELIITDIYPASEKPIEGITSQRFVEEIKKINPNFEIKYMPYDYSLDSFSEHIKNNSTKDDLVLLLGAGRLNLVAQKVIE